NRPDNILEKFKITHRGKVYLARAKELFAWTLIFLDCKVPKYISDDDVLHSASNNYVGPQQGGDDLVVDSDVEGVSETIFDDNLTLPVNSVYQSAVNESDPSLSHPPGFTPEASRQVDDPIGEGIDTGFVKESSHSVHSKVMNNSEEVSKGNSEFRHSHNHKGGSILEVLDDMVRVGQSMGYDMDGCINDIEHIIRNQGDDAISNNSKVLIVVVYAPQSLALKRALLGVYLVIDISLGRARAFNRFIEASGLVDVKLKGYSFTWSHPSASKMSKLDRFLVSKGAAKSIKENLTDIDKNLDRGNVSDELLLKRMDFTRQLLEIKQMESKDWVQKSKIKWAIEGDENSKYFHDGFTFEFFRRYWSFISPDFCLVIDCFFESGNFPMGSNASFIALIPEVTNAKFVTDFKPISLIGCVYKVVTKILPNRLAMVITDLVSDTQYAFVSSRQILDGPFILNELIACSSMASVLVNGNPSSEFPFFCGLKQGDPLAPYLFILIMESLHISFSRATSAGVFNGIWFNDSTVISHLFYVDDAIFMGEWSDSNMANIVNILRCFFLASGLKINIQKSQILGVGVHRNHVSQAALLIGYMVMKTPFRYLGVMVGDCMARKSACFDIVHKSHHRLSKWKVKTLSIGGRLTLLKSVLGATPLYNMSIYKVPIGILKEMEMIRSNFFKGADHSDRKISWVSWEKVLTSKKNGGLKVYSFYALNRALLLKWVWRFISQDGSLWCDLAALIFRKICRCPVLGVLIDVVFPFLRRFR
nr:RNA-directed DNA polymerase, eukaryota [Tanacetum cinerariifolium]